MISRKCVRKGAAVVVNVSEMFTDPGEGPPFRHSSAAFLDGDKVVTIVLISVLRIVVLRCRLLAVA